MVTVLPVRCAIFFLIKQKYLVVVFMPLSGDGFCRMFPDPAWRSPPAKPAS
jgi:hypothetical protein